MADRIEHPDEERDVAELDALLVELVSEARDIERYTQWGRHARAETESRQGVDEALAKIRATFTALRQQLTEAQADRERLDWLESQAGTWSLGFVALRGKWRCEGPDDALLDVRFTSAREALDAARLASSSEKPNG